MNTVYSIKYTVIYDIFDGTMHQNEGFVLSAVCFDHPSHKNNCRTKLSNSARAIFSASFFLPDYYSLIGKIQNGLIA